MTVTRLVCRQVVSEKGTWTTIRMEPEMLLLLDEIANRENVPVCEIIARAVAENPQGSRTSAIRVYIVTYLRRKAGELTRVACG